MSFGPKMENYCGKIDRFLSFNTIVSRLINDHNEIQINDKIKLVHFLYFQVFMFIKSWKSRAKMVAPSFGEWLIAFGLSSLKHEGVSVPHVVALLRRLFVPNKLVALKMNNFAEHINPPLTPHFCQSDDIGSRNLNNFLKHPKIPKIENLSFNFVTHFYFITSTFRWLVFVRRFKCHTFSRFYFHIRIYMIFDIAIASTRAVY